MKRKQKEPVVTKAWIMRKTGMKTPMELANYFGITPDAVRKWGDDPIPKKNVHFLKAVRPDLFA